MQSTGIRVNAINPATVKPTSLEQFYFYGEGIEQIYAKYEHIHPLHGRNSTAEEQARTIMFLASPAASFITGQYVKVDGGYSLYRSKVVY
ncbi:3-oxoacyl-[acyl-carrier-protein] reductase FabG [Biomphalaria pfeifferi]|uniref:Peroxisomal trans-2-enoyl-CoA reductase n=1 Tax=Biomphalaria pfeifferi TaxID=112525 RepID=A0AAD8F1M7_BIOPF|nr:3-oxoacyl-[acyl-carrier-protein] reductase FabG [Biomphalaria pfeifferi]